MPRTAIVLFSRDLRVRDNPALTAAVQDAEQVVPLFVLDDGMIGGRHVAPARIAYLVDALTDLRAALRERHGDLIVRRGGLRHAVMRLVREVDAAAVHCAGDVSAHARAIRDGLARACAETRVEFTTHPGVTVVDPGEVTPAGGDHYRVFTPYWRAWEQAPRRTILPAPGRLRLPVHPAARLAGLLPPGHSRLPGHHHARLPAAPRGLGRRPGRLRLLARGPYGHPDRGRRHAPAAGRGLHAQPGPLLDPETMPASG